MSREKISVIAIAGPTASGKSALAVKTALRYGGEIVSLDSMQIYKRMDIGTAKPTAEETALVTHHMLDICEPSEKYSAADFCAAARRVIEDIAARGKLPVLCGGTGLYLNSIIDGIEFGEMKGSEELRTTLAAFAAENGAEALHERLCALDAEAAAAIPAGNVKRVIRAIEICTLSGMTKTEWDKKARSEEKPYNSRIFALDYKNRELLRARIDARVDLMLQAGLYNEVKALYDAGELRDGSTASQAIGYKEMLLAVTGEITVSEAAELIKTATKQYAKRQLTWLRRRTDITWLYPDEKDPEIIL